MESRIPVVISGVVSVKRRRIFSGQVFVKDECFHGSFDILWVHKGFLIRSAGQRALAIG